MVLGWNKSFTITFLLAVVIAFFTKNIYYFLFIVGFYALIRILFNFFTHRI